MNIFACHYVAVAVVSKLNRTLSQVYILKLIEEHLK